MVSEDVHELTGAHSGGGLAFPTVHKLHAAYAMRGMTPRLKVGWQVCKSADSKLNAGVLRWHYGVSWPTGQD